MKTLDYAQRLLPGIGLRELARRTGTLLHARGMALVALACIVGAIAGVLVTGISWIVQTLHWLLFGLAPGARLSGMFSLSTPGQALVPVVGGMLVGLTVLFLRRGRYRAPIDPIEANALHGGRMSLTDTIIVSLQTIISSGFGASVGLEASYTQAGSGVASWLARTLRLRRADVRMLVGCGSAGAIAAAFDAPLTGAFYGFELIIGVYSVAQVAPVLASALTASLVAGMLGATPFPVEIDPLPPLAASQYLPFIVLGLVAGVASILTMRLVALTEQLFPLLSPNPVVRPVVGGVIVGLLGLVTPQVLGGGHGALHRELAMNYGLAVVSSLFALKLIASAVSLGSGFRGGLFFASLFLGVLLGKIFVGVSALVVPWLQIDPTVAAVVGMTSLAVGIVGGPLTLTFLTLESSGNLTLTGVVLAAAIVSSLVVRETFGYSFSTWRFHLRGETIRSAYDIGWMRNLTVGSMMRSDARTVDASTTVEEFGKRFPLGSTQRVVAVDGEGRYVGMLLVADIYAERPGGESGAASVGSFAKYRDAVLVPTMNVKSAADTFARVGSEELAVVSDFMDRKVVGLLTERHLMRRYAEEMEKASRDISGDAPWKAGG